MEYPRDWESFMGWLRETYWSSLPSDMRISSRPDAAEDDPDVPDDVWQAALLIFPSPDAWLTNPIPNQGGLSPLQLIGGGQVERVQAILMEMAPAFLPDPEDLLPPGGGAR